MPGARDRPMSDGYRTTISLTASGRSATVATVCQRLRIQPVNATALLNISAGVWKSKVFLGLSFSLLATALSLACE